ncbi:MAG: hypothetical protein CUN55_00830 [Phototrophicales bacterium]|nr:MAG: hypothetical protein CUN55_00830 [Phototrophicales bacterium]
MIVLFMVFILLGLTLGVGMMLAPALPTSHPRVAVAGVLCLALVMSGSLFHAGLFGWDILLVDYLWFALITGVFLGGTLTVGMRRVEAAIAEGKDAHLGWPSLLTMSVFGGWGLITLLILSSQSSPQQLLEGFSTLHRHINAFQHNANLSSLNTRIDALGPGLPTILAYFDAQLPIDVAVGLVGWIVSLQVIWLWLAYDIGSELELKTQYLWAWIGLAALIGILCINKPIILTELVLAGGFCFFVWHWMNHNAWFDFVAAAVCAAATILVFPLVATGLLVIYCALMLLRGSHNFKINLLGAIGIVSLTILGISPWLVSLI